MKRGQMFSPLQALPWTDSIVGEVQTRRYYWTAPQYKEFVRKEQAGEYISKCFTTTVLIFENIIRVQNCETRSIVKQTQSGFMSTQIINK